MLAEEFYTQCFYIVNNVDTPPPQMYFLLYLSSELQPLLTAYLTFLLLRLNFELAIFSPIFGCLGLPYTAYVSTIHLFLQARNLGIFFDVFFSPVYSVHQLGSVGFATEISLESISPFLTAVFLV